MKFLLWALIVLAVVYWLARPKKQSSLKQDARENLRNQGKSERSVQDGDGESMVQCAQCEVHVPASEAFAGHSGLLFCCEEHALQHASR